MTPGNECNNFARTKFGCPRYRKILEKRPLLPHLEDDKMQQHVMGVIRSQSRTDARTKEIYFVFLFRRIFVAKHFRSWPLFWGRKTEVVFVFTCSIKGHNFCSPFCCCCCDMSRHKKYGSGLSKYCLRSRGRLLYAVMAGGRYPPIGTIFGSSSKCPFDRAAKAFDRFA